jgi:Putative Flp pilus-assembly TadE/G-like
MAKKTFLRANRSQSGNVAMVFALTAVAAVGVVGGGVEITRVVDGRAKLQSAIDAGALAAAGMPENSGNGAREATANKVVLANLELSRGIVAGSLSVTPSFAVTSEVSLIGEVKLESVLGKSIFGNFHTIKVNATALKATAGSAAVPGTSPAPVCAPQPAAIDAPAQYLPPAPAPTTTAGTASPAANGCVWALGTGNTNGAITFNAGNQINAPTCRMHVHSTDNDSVFHNWGNDITIDALYSKGRINCNKPCSSNFQSYATTRVLNDPYASNLPQLTAGPCVLGNNWVSYDTANVTLSPGTYCGGINFNSGVRNIRLNPGVYHIKSDWNMNGATVDAPGVTLYFDSNSNFQLNGNTRLNLSAPTSGPTAGLAMYEKYGLGQGTRAIDARGGLNISGVIYFPTKQLNFNSGNNVTSVALQIVGRVIHFNDSDFNLSPYTGPLPPGVTLPGGTPGVTTTYPAPPPTSTGSGLFFNGSFESPSATAGSVYKRSIADGLVGWTTTRMFELHNSAFTAGFGGYGTDGVQYAELEKDLTQAITLPAGKTYRFQFDYRLGDNGSAADNRFLVNWGDKQLADIQPFAPPGASANWKRITFPIRGTGNPISLTFTQLIGANFDHGAFLDRVRIEEDTTLTAPADGCPGGLPAPPATPGTPAVPATPVRLVR